MEESYQSIGRSRTKSDASIASETLAAQNKAKLVSRCLALLCVGVAVLAWVALAEVLQNLQMKDKEGNTYSKPMFLCFCIRTTYTICFLPYVLWKFTPLGGAGRRDPEPFSAAYMFSRGCILNTLGYLSAYTWYMSLPITSVSANTAIYMCACAAVFLISIPVLREKITVVKVLSLLVCCTGIVLVSLFSTPQQKDIVPKNTTFTDNLWNVNGGETKTSSSVLGYILVLVSMFLYAAYEVFYGYMLQTDQDKHPVMTSLKLIGYLGLSTPLLFGIALPIWHFSGWETLQLPPPDKIELFMLSVILDTGFNTFLLLAIALSNPTLASVGQSLALPASMVADLILHHFLMPWPALTGAGCVFLGFCGFVYAELKPDDAPESTAEDQEGLLEGEETPPPPYEQESSFSSAEGEVQTAVIA